MKPKWMVMEEDLGGDGGRSAAGGGGGGNTEVNEAQARQMEMLTRSLGMMADGFTKMQETQATIVERLEALGKGKSREDDNSGDQSTSRSDVFGDVDMEQLDRKDFAALIMTKFQDRMQHYLGEALKPLNDNMKALGTQIIEGRTERELETAQRGRPDFMEWRQEIAALVKETPGLRLDRAYVLARQENEKKAKEMDEKYKEKPAGSPRGFGGFVPVSGGGGGEGATKMKFAEAAERAWNDVLGGVDISTLPVVGGGQR